MQRPRQYQSSPAQGLLPRVYIYIPEGVCSPGMGGIHSLFREGRSLTGPVPPSTLLQGPIFLWYKDPTHRGLQPVPLVMCRGGAGFYILITPLDHFLIKTMEI